MTSAHLIIHPDGSRFVSTMNCPSNYLRAERYRVFEILGEDIGYGFRIDQTVRELTRKDLTP